MNNINISKEWTWVFTEGLGKAYGNFLQNTLGTVTTLKSAEPFFYFTNNLKTTTNFPLGGSDNIYKKDLNLKKYWGESWTPPPLKNYYSKKSLLKTDKEVVVINNKYISEWNAPKCWNHIDLKTIESLFNILQDKYEIYYIRYKGNYDSKEEYFDHGNQKSLIFNDYELLLKYPQVKTIYSFMEDHKVGFNTAQCMVMSKSTKHISVAGGNATLSSYFGGDNIIFTSGDCKAANRGIWHTNSWLKELGNSNIIGVQNYVDLLKSVSHRWL